MSSLERTALAAPHEHIETRDTRERFALRLFDALWSKYRSRVPYVRDYESVVSKAGGKFVNDHIAFRTIAMQQPATGIATISRVFESLGYTAAGAYSFPDKNLSSIHFQHSHPEFPKIFISELRTWELPPECRKILARTLASHRSPLADGTLAELASLEDASQIDRLLKKVLPLFQKMPWDPPRKNDVLAVNEVSQFGAWVMLHGYAVNHFTALINSHGVRVLSNIDKTVAALRKAGVPMKPSIEGASGSKLRQTATEAAEVSVKVRDKNGDATMPWTYAYFELAERGMVADPETGRRARFEGFLGPQATQLFEMTRRSKETTSAVKR